MSQFQTPDDLLSSTGQDLGISDWLTIDQSRIDGFAELTGDRQWIHVDVERAKRGPFGAPIAHGYLTLSLAPVFLQEVVSVSNVGAAVNYGLNKVRFPAPVVVGSRLRGHVSLLSAARKATGVEAVFGLTVEIDNHTRPALVAEPVVLYS